MKQSVVIKSIHSPFMFTLWRVVIIVYQKENILLDIVKPNMDFMHSQENTLLVLFCESRGTWGNFCNKWRLLWE